MASLQDAIKFIEEKIPGYVEHEADAARKVLAAHYSEYAATVAQVQSLEKVAEHYRGQLDTLQKDIAAAEEEIAKLTGNAPKPAETPAPAAPAPARPQPGQPVTS